MIYPYLSYCNIVWCSNYKTNLRNLEVLQNKSVRLLLSYADYKKTNIIYKDFEILKLIDIYNVQLSIFIYKYKNLQLPEYFYTYPYFYDINTTHTHVTRHSHLLSIQYARTNTRKFHPKCTGPKLWNSLPQGLTSTQNPYKFKRDIKTFFHNTYNC